MQKAVAKEGLRAPLFCFGVVLLLAAGGSAAQTVQQSDLQLCASLETPELKLACFEALTVMDDKETPSAVDTTPAPPPESATKETALITAGAAAVVAAPDADRAAPAAVADDERADSIDELDGEGADEVQVNTGDELDEKVPDEAPVALVDELSRESPDETQVDLADEIGREHLDEDKADEQESALLRVTVSKVVKGSYDVLYFHFSNGQIWRQVESRRFSYPRDGDFDVIIDSGMMGDYRLRLDTGGPMTRIRRVQ